MNSRSGSVFYVPVMMAFFVILLLFMGIGSAFAQTKGQITGAVVDDQGDPVIGATVSVGGKAGGVTDLDGNFKVMASPGTKLTVSYIGFKPITVEAKAGGMKISLVPDVNQIQEVQVVAYGTQKKVTVTGALSSIKGDDLNKTSVSNINNVLAGQLTGITTVQYSGEPGSDAATIFVRGQGTFNDSSPLIEVDGVERSMSDIDPNDIASITVLKDASATAVFGVRGANGVILITTKRGEDGKAKISASTSFSILQATKMVDQASSYEYAQYYNQMCENDGLEDAFSDAVIQKFKDGSDPIRFPSTKWVDYCMKTATTQTQHNVNISGGNSKIKYFISAGFFSQGGLFKEFGQSYDYGYQYNRFNFRSNLDMDITNTTTLSINIAGNTNTITKKTV